MKFLDGYKSYIGSALGVIVGVLMALGYLTPEQAAAGGTVAAAVFGAGFAGKVQKLAEATASSMAKGDAKAEGS
jgi:hypothetical protein